MLVKLRASQINGCAYCIDMHTKDARAFGDTEQRQYLVAAWREALTLLAQGGVSETLHRELAEAFEATELVTLSLAIIEINGWNRACRSPSTRRPGWLDRASSEEMAKGPVAVVRAGRPRYGLAREQVPLAPPTEDAMTQEHGESYPKLREVLGEEAFAELAQLIRKTYEANEERRRRSGGDGGEVPPGPAKPSR